MKPKVHYSWLGTDKKKTYLILSLDTEVDSNKNTDRNNVFLARLLGILTALWMSDIDKVHVWLDIFTKLFE